MPPLSPHVLDGEPVDMFSTSSCGANNQVEIIRRLSSEYAVCAGSNQRLLVVPSRKSCPNQLAPATQSEGEEWLGQGRKDGTYLKMMVDKARRCTFVNFSY
jgi:hypothetical protein